MSFRFLFILISVIAILALVGGGIFFWQQGNVKKGLNIDLTVPEEISSGAPFDLLVGIKNESQSILNDAELMIELPEGIAFIGSSPEKIISSKRLGNIGEGSFVQEEFQLIALGGENTVKEIKATVSYMPKALGSRFERSESASFSIVNQSISLDISMPQKVFSGEEFEIEISYKNVGNRDLSDLRLKVLYPPSFTFISSSLKPDFGNNVWNLGDLRSNSEGKITVKGQLIGSDDSFFETKLVLEARFLGRSYTISEKTSSIAIAASPLSLKIVLNNAENSVAYTNQELDYVLNFTNNTDVGLRDVIVSAKLIGEMFDLATLNTNASLRSSNNTLIWNAANTPELAILQPKSSGSVGFRVKTSSNYPIRRLSDKNFILKVDAAIESPTVPYNVSAQKTIGVAKIETKIGGQIIADAKGFFRDAQSGVINSGPWPLRVGQPTNFTIHWVITNFSTDVKDVKVRAFLGNNVRMIKVVKSNGGTEPKYNERTQEITWDIPGITATKGVLTSPIEAVFQIEATPSIAQAGTSIVLMQDTSIEAIDDFTGENLRNRDSAVTSSSLDDPTVKTGEGTVLP